MVIVGMTSTCSQEDTHIIVLTANDSISLIDQYERQHKLLEQYDLAELVVDMLEKRLEERNLHRLLDDIYGE